MPNSEERPTQQHRPWMAGAIKAIDIVSWVIFALWLWLPKGTHWISVLLDLVLLWIVARSVLLVGLVNKKSKPSPSDGAGSAAET